MTTKEAVAKRIIELCNERNITIVDCTCEFVRRTQKIVDEQHRLGKTIVIVGEKTHPEVVGVNGWCNNEAIIIKNIEEINNVIKNLMKFFKFSSCFDPFESL